MAETQDLRELRGEMRGWFAAIDSRLRALEIESASTGAGVKALVADSQDHESRIRSLERKVWTLSAFASALGACVGAAVSWLVRHT